MDNKRKELVRKVFLLWIPYFVLIGCVGYLVHKFVNEDPRIERQEQLAESLFPSVPKPGYIDTHGFARFKDAGSAEIIITNIGKFVGIAIENKGEDNVAIGVFLAEDARSIGMTIIDASEEAEKAEAAARDRQDRYDAMKKPGCEVI